MSARQLSSPPSASQPSLRAGESAHHAPPEGSDWWLWLRKFAKHGKSIASVAPSSRFLARMTCKGIDYNSAKVIVELGAGTGPVTQELLRCAKPGTRVVIVELDGDFCDRLRAKFPTADIVHGDAAHMDELLRERGIEKVDHIISGLPLPSFPAALRDSIIGSAVRSLADGGSFRQLTVMPMLYWKLYKRYFDSVKFKMVTLNVPPGGVYICHGAKVPAVA